MSQPTFRRDSEAEAYQLLHENGLADFQAANPTFGTALLNDWHERGLCRITHRTIKLDEINPRTGKPRTDYRLEVRTYKKYATGRTR